MCSNPQLPLRARAYKKAIHEATECLRSTGKEWLEERRAAIQRDEYVPQDILTTLVKLQGNFKWFVSMK